MNKVEDYTVVSPTPPEAFDLLASGVKIAEVITRSDSIFVLGFTQKRWFPVDLFKGIEEYAARIGRKVEWVLWDSDYDRYEFNTSIVLKDKNDNQ